MKLEHVAVTLGHYHTHSVTRQQLPRDHQWSCQPLVSTEWAPPQATNCQGVTVSHPAQPLVSTAMGPSHKQPTVKECPLVILLGHWSAQQWAPPTSSLVGCPGSHLSQSDPLVVLLSYGGSQAPPTPFTSNRLSRSNCQWSRSAISQHCSGPCPQATDCQGATDGEGIRTRISQSGGWQVESKVKGRALSPPLGLSSSPGLEWVVS